MKIAIATSENHVKSPVDAHFGRCNWFCIFDTDTKTTIFIENASRHQVEKAGREAADILVEHGITIAIAGRFGSKVVEVFQAKNIQMIVPEKPTTIQSIIKKL